MLIARVIAISFFLPLFEMMIRTFDCTKREDGSWTLDAECDTTVAPYALLSGPARYQHCTRCFDHSSAARESISAILGVLLFYCSYRLMRVGGELSRVKLWSSRLFKNTLGVVSHMRLDSNTEAVRVHPFSISDKGYIFERKMTVCKAILSGLIFTMGTRHPKVVSICVTVMGAYMLLLLRKYPPHFDRRTNCGWLVTYCGVAALYFVAMIQACFGLWQLTVAIGTVAFIGVVVVLCWVCNSFDVEWNWCALPFGRSRDRIYPL